MNADLQIRGEDFRKAWPNALAISLREAAQLADQLEVTKDSVVELAKKTPLMLQAADDRLAASTNLMIQKIDEASQKFRLEIGLEHQSLVKTHGQILELIATQLNQLEATKKDTDLQLANVQKERVKLEEERKKYKKSGFLSRIFNKNV